MMNEVITKWKNENHNFSFKGTRDDAQSLNLSNGPTWREHIQNVLKHMYSCCKTQGNSQEILAFENPAFDDSTSNASLNPPGISDDFGTNDDKNNTFILRGEDDEPVGTWLVDMPDEARILKMNGFEKTSFISGITRDEMKSIGIHGDIQLSKIMKKVDSLKDFEIQLDIPDNVESWLRNIDLEQYKDKFDGVNLKVKEDLEMLANCNINAIVKSVNMTKKGHIRRLHKAIKRLQNPSKAQIKLMEALDVIENMDSSTVFHEAEFWEKFRKEYLIPRSNVSESDAHLKGKLQKLRNNWLIIFALINIMWLTLIATLAYKGKLLGVFGSDPVGFAVVVGYGVILVIQFLAMIVHRLSTLLYYLGIIPYKFNTDYYSSWVFHDRQVSIDQADENKLKRSKYRSRRK